MNIFLHPDQSQRQAFIDSLGVSACILEPTENDGLRIAVMNDLCRDFFGFSKDTKKLTLDIQSVRDASGSTRDDTTFFLERAIESNKRCIETKMIVRTENSTIRADGSVRWSRNVITPLVQGGTVKATLSINHDISHYVMAQVELEEHLERLVGKHVKICHTCRNVLHESGEWLSIEAFMSRTGKMKFSHGMCDTCLVRHS